MGQCEVNGGLLNRDVGPLCLRCGLCCTMLSAKVSEEKAETISEENNIPKEKFCHIEEEGTGPNPGELVLHMPCKFLAGRPADYVRCLIYKKTRPDVCGVYLCRIALQYKNGLVELEEAVSIIRKAYFENKPGLFNWIGLLGEKELQQSVVIPPTREYAKDFVEKFGEDGKLGGLDAYEVGNIFIAEKVTPTYLIHSDFAHLELNLLLSFFDQGIQELSDVLPQSVIDQLNPEAKELALVIYTAMLTKLRSLYFTEDEIQRAAKNKQ